MTELEDSLRAIEGAEGFFEGIWMHKRNGICYLSYSMNGNIGYCMGTSPLGPFVYKGIVLTWTGTMTNHSSIVEYRGEWLIFYHNQALPGGNAYKRSVCADRLSYNADGTMKLVVQTARGVSFPTSVSRNRRSSSSGTALYQVTGTTITVPAAATITVLNARAAVVLWRRTGGTSSVNFDTLPAGRYSAMIERQGGWEQRVVVVQ